jgi:hypothetical protein
MRVASSLYALLRSPAPNPPLAIHPGNPLVKLGLGDAPRFHPHAHQSTLPLAGDEYIVQLSKHACRNRFFLEEPSTVGLIGDVQSLVLARVRPSAKWLSRDRSSLPRYCVLCRVFHVPKLTAT